MQHRFNKRYKQPSHTHTLTPTLTHPNHQPLGQKQLWSDEQNIHQRSSQHVDEGEHAYGHEELGGAGQRQRPQLNVITGCHVGGCGVNSEVVVEAHIGVSEGEVGSVVDWWS